MLPPDRTLASRFELKYWLTPELVGAVRRAIRPFVRPDRYAVNRPGYRYPLSSLYLDNSSLDLYQTTVDGQRNRFKLRIRSYGDAPEAPVFCEVKRRTNLVVLKSRARVERAVAMRFLRGEPVHADLPSSFAEFTQLAQRIRAHGVLRVRYEREAYESKGRDPVRITIDTGLMQKPTPVPDLSLGGSGWCEVPIPSPILEVKFTDACPAWVRGMVQSLSLERTSIPKYILCVDKALEQRSVTRVSSSPAVT